MALISFTGAPHGGSHKLLPEWNRQPRITPTTIIDHSIVGSALGAWYYFRDRTGLESHFIVRGAPSGSADGHIWQLMDTGRRADANLNANAFAISIETEDNGDPDNFPWSRAQLASLRWLHAKLRAVHPTIPRQRCLSPRGGGLGHHSMWGAPSPWTPVAGKTCPGKPVRVRQWEQILVPAFISSTTSEEEFILATREELRSELMHMCKVLIQGEHTGLWNTQTGSAFDLANWPSLASVRLDLLDRLKLHLYRLLKGQNSVYSTITQQDNEPQENLADLKDRLVRLERKIDQLLPPPG
jgi:hypothetical protein